MSRKRDWYESNNIPDQQRQPDRRNVRSDRQNDRYPKVENDIERTFFSSTSREGQQEPDNRKAQQDRKRSRETTNPSTQMQHRYVENNRERKAVNLSSQSDLPTKGPTTDAEIMQFGAEQHWKQKYNELAARYYEASIENESKLREIKDDTSKDLKALEIANKKELKEIKEENEQLRAAYEQEAETSKKLKELKKKYKKDLKEKQEETDELKNATDVINEQLQETNKQLRATLEQKAYPEANKELKEMKKKAQKRITREAKRNRRVKKNN